MTALVVGVVHLGHGVGVGGGAHTGLIGEQAAGYLANIENKGTIPSLPVVIQLIKVCGLPVEQYFNPEIIRGDSEQRQRVSHKLKLCPEHYLPVIEGAIDGALKIEQSAKETGDM